MPDTIVFLDQQLEDRKAELEAAEQRRLALLHAPQDGEIEPRGERVALEDGGHPPRPREERRAAKVQHGRGAGRGW